MMQEPPAADVLVAELRQFADRAANLLAASDICWSARPAEGGWSLASVACHLRDVEREVHQLRLQRVMHEERAFLSGVVADAWVEERDYESQDGRVALAEFLAAREETLEILEGLEPEIWHRSAQHAFFGATTTQELVYLIVQHDAAHWEQIAQLTARVCV